MTHSKTVLNDLLPKPEETVVLRHAPWSERRHKQSKWKQMINVNPRLLNEYQQTQLSRKIEVNEMLSNAQFVASFIGHGRGKAKFVGLYKIIGNRRKDTIKGCRQDMETTLSKMEEFEICAGVDYLVESKEKVVYRYVFRLLENIHPELTKDMVIDWACGDRNWFQRADQYEFPVLSPS